MVGLLVAGIAACGRIAFDATALPSDSAPSSDSALGPDAAPCTPGMLALPHAAFDSSPIAGESCAQQNILVEDGAVAGLERYSYGAFGLIDGQEVAGCITVDLGELRTFDPIVVRAGPVADACGQPCGLGECNTGHEFSLFAGATAGTLALVRYQTFTSTALADYAFTIGPLRYVAVCRTSYSRDRDDVAVDVVRGTCQ